MNDFDKWMEQQFTKETILHQNIPKIRIRPHEYDLTITPAQAARLIAHLATLIGDIPLEMVFDKYRKMADPALGPEDMERDSP